MILVFFWQLKMRNPDNFSARHFNVLLRGTGEEYFMAVGKWLTYKTKKGTLNLKTQLEVHHSGPLIQVKVIVFSKQ